MPALTCCDASAPATSPRGALVLAHLTSFLAVVDHGSVTAAARHLNYSQPAVTLHLKALEQCLSIQLFARCGRPLVLTEAGRLLLPRARQIEQLTRLTEIMFEQRTS